MRVRLGSAWIFGAAIGALAMGACFSFGDLSGSNAEDGGSDGSSGDANSGDGNAGSGDGGSESGVPGACANKGGPSPVRVTTSAGTFCIDSTEVTIRDYADFLQAVDAGTAAIAQPPECAWNTTFAASGATDLFKPVTSVDWCDAWSFCAWSGKHLCGKIGGGALPYDGTVGDPAKAEWVAACSYAPDGGVQSYPYGNTPSATACNGSERDAGTVVDVASLAECVGGFPGVFDMSGNVDEWTDSCDGTGGATDCCVTLGGGFRDFETACGVGDSPPATCAGRTRSDVHSDVGFRCCSE